MCGIAGIYEKNGMQASRELLLDMAGELRHRGPDGTGLYTDGRCGLVNTRLSIVDLGGGDQPIGNEDGRYWVVQNGEIYNHPSCAPSSKRTDTSSARTATPRCSSMPTSSGAKSASTA